MGWAPVLSRGLVTFQDTRESLFFKRLLSAYLACVHQPPVTSELKAKLCRESGNNLQPSSQRGVNLLGNRLVRQTFVDLTVQHIVPLPVSAVLPAATVLPSHPALLPAAVPLTPAVHLIHLLVDLNLLVDLAISSRGFHELILDFRSSTDLTNCLRSPKSGNCSSKTRTSKRPVVCFHISEFLNHSVYSGFVDSS